MSKPGKNISSRRYGTSGSRGRNKQHKVRREMVRAEARIRHIMSRQKRGLIKEEVAKTLIERQQEHIKLLKQRDAKGYGHRAGYSVKSNSPGAPKKKASKKDAE